MVLDRIQRHNRYHISIPMLLIIYPAIVYSLAHLDIVVIELLLLFYQVLLILFDLVLFFEVLTVDGWVYSVLVFGFLDDSLAYLVLGQVLVVLVF